MRAVLIAGPTASGKSSLAMEMAVESGGVVINADSMQVYDTLQILTARPTAEDMQAVDHCLYGHVPAVRAYSVGNWYRDIETLLSGPDLKGRDLVFVGGTGLFFRSLTGGLSQMPPIPASIRQQWRDALVSEGVEVLHAQLAKKDPDMAAQLNVRDSQRIVRALEVFDASGRSIRSFQGEPGNALIDPGKAQKIVFTPDRTVLRERITARFETMLETGAIGEVQRLLEQDLNPDLPAMKAIGVREIAAHLAGKISAEQVVELASIATRQYAKRQMTWFRHQLGEDWQVRN
ncbi:MAG: tRNA (adenosine(37)-N6)-dimethylallyltransferase MiaA [Hyphomicrobiales bacterium]|nr:tRNA (adenosine(37)-N6)-dimethylallyltransferase MiaA [Hyphomicrobiales bacterium]MCP4999490.1 tRNA (adenosine(37)-N6)-dimethylallyltransferase MiaA [Hyphomicrobiales bacterium]